MATSPNSEQLCPWKTTLTDEVLMLRPIQCLSYR